ncbi:uncharacterized protein LOC132038479 [Lycium ferocissimum]|uniref:uncharacterized protein LOC132038479 n=1 Tax=Lycium ferocissimum TaxID=112874 RepID=UPI002815931D|nr:uncharacterized protein LOC132038479 [Lycium ferocissimum]
MSRSSETSNFAIEPDVCECDRYCKLKTSRTEENPGRHFWRCKVLEDMGDYKHLCWEDSILVDKMAAAKIKKPLVDRDTATSRISRDTVKFDLQFKLMEAKEKIDLLEVLLKEFKEK